MFFLPIFEKKIKTLKVHIELKVGEILKVKVKVGDYRLGFEDDFLETVGLGSCVGVAIFDKKNKIAGLAHIMLPDSTNFSCKNKLKFADYCLEKMIEDIKGYGGDVGEFRAKICGGSNMFNVDSKSTIGTRNLEAVKNILRKYKITVVATDVGGCISRTMTVSVLTNEVLIRNKDNIKKI